MKNNDIINKPADTNNRTLVEIEVVGNGAVLRYPEGSYVFTFDQEHLGGLVDLLCAINDTIGHIGSKWDKERIKVSIVHGSDYKCKEKRCPICKEGA